MDWAAILRVSGCAGSEAADFELAHGPDLKSQISPLTQSWQSIKPTYVQITANLYQLMVGLLWQVFYSYCSFSSPVVISQKLQQLGLVLWVSGCVGWAQAGFGLRAHGIGLDPNPSLVVSRIHSLKGAEGGH